MTTLRLRLGSFPNELDAVRHLHQRQDVAGPDDQVTTTCRTCYILDEGWPCAVARLIAVVDAQIADEEAAREGRFVQYARATAWTVAASRLGGKAS